MARNFVQPGSVMTFTAAAAISSGDGVLIGKRLGVALGDVANAAQGEAQVDGVFNLPVLGTDVVAQGDLLYWDNTNKRLTKTSTSNTLAGYAFGASANGITSVDIKLNG